MNAAMMKTGLKQLGSRSYSGYRTSFTSGVRKKTQWSLSLSRLGLRSQSYSQSDTGSGSWSVSGSGFRMGSRSTKNHAL